MPPEAGRARVVGTAGHIDHGKSRLVAALTGVGTDRLPEEQARGISIDLGFAPLDLGPDEPPASVVDVPGHEAFIRNMVAGATGIDAVLLTVAADEGIMPQTLEHLLVLRALGVERGVVAVTKIDLVEQGWLDLVIETIVETLSGTPLSDAPIVPVSATTGTGVEAVRRALATVLSSTPARRIDLPFRMPIDRAFQIAGAGTVVTGTVWSGRVEEESTLIALPAGGGAGRTRRPAPFFARVRTIESHAARMASVDAGRRAALSLVGPSVDRAARGFVLVEPDRGWRSMRSMEIEAWVATSAKRPIRSHERIRIHHGTSEVMGRITWYGRPVVAEGESGCARVALEGPLVAAVGDRLVLRRYSPVTTIGGGIVLTRSARPLRGKSRAERGEIVTVLAGAHGADLVGRVIEAAGKAGIDGSELPLETGLGESALGAALRETGPTIERHGGRWFARALRRKLAGDLETVLHDHMLAHPFEAGMGLAEARHALRPADPALVEAAIESLLRTGRLARTGGVLALAGRELELSAEDRRLLDGVRSALAGAGLEAPDAGQLADRLEVDPARVRPVMSYLERAQRVVRLAGDWYVDATALAAAEQALSQYLAREGHADVGACKSLLGVSRKYLIPILEHFDRSGLTRREENQRVLAR